MKSVNEYDSYESLRSCCIRLRVSPPFALRSSHLRLNWSMLFRDLPTKDTLDSASPLCDDWAAFAHPLLHLPTVKIHETLLVIQRLTPLCPPSSIPQPTCIAQRPSIPHGSAYALDLRRRCRRSISTCSRQ
ncbi:hypothetical protein R3P38DRAFT_3193016 [Favolaschia claudopus]|uniref:Uncharacterized protein n=1 Tax=Favolaschia claudopus TaxID=2862362 RepID=A0AAW0BI32_9AGAR